MLDIKQRALAEPLLRLTGKAVLKILFSQITITLVINILHKQLVHALLWELYFAFDSLIDTLKLKKPLLLSSRQLILLYQFLLYRKPARVQIHKCLHIFNITFVRMINIRFQRLSGIHRLLYQVLRAFLEVGPSLLSLQCDLVFHASGDFRRVPHHRLPVDVPCRLVNLLQLIKLCKVLDQPPITAKRHW